MSDTAKVRRARNKKGHVVKFNTTTSRGPEFASRGPLGNTGLEKMAMCFFHSVALLILSVLGLTSHRFFFFFSQVKLIAIISFVPVFLYVVFVCLFVIFVCVFLLIICL